MRKRILSFLLAVVMIFTLLPLSVAAEGEPECDHNSWTAITDLSGIVAGGSYYLTADVNLSSTWNVPAGDEIKLCLNGHIIKNVGGNYYSVINVPAGAKLSLYDCDTTEHFGHINDKGVWVPDETKQANGNVSVFGGYISGGTGRWDGTYSSNTKLYGGGVYVGGTYSNQAVFSMYGGNIVGNLLDEEGSGNVTPCGGGVYVAAYGNFIMKGGTIQGNSTINSYKQSNGGGVCIASSGTMIVGGNAVVKNNYGISNYNSNLHTDNVYGGSLEINNPSEKMSVGVNCGGTFDPGKDCGSGIIGRETDAKYLSPDNENYSFVYRETEYGNYLYLHCGGFNLCNGSGFTGGYPGDDEFGIFIYDYETDSIAIDNDYAFDGWYTERTGGTKICDGKPETIIPGKDYYAHWTYKGSPVLTEKMLVYATGVQIGGKIVENANIATEFGDYGLSYNETDGVVADGTVITSIKEYGYPYYGDDYTYSEPAGVIICESDAKFLLNSGSIRGNFEIDYYGEVNCASGVMVFVGTFVMNGGSIDNNFVPTGETYPGSGGGVYIADAGNFIMNNGSIVNNGVNGAGGGVYVTSGGSFTMNGGLISENVALEDYNGSFGVGGGVCVEENGLFQAYGGTITDNYAEYAGGGVYIAKGTSEDGEDPKLTCLANGTLITLADGTKTAIENLKVGDTVRVFDHETGMLSTSKLYVLEKIPSEPNTAFTLHFTSGIDVTAVNSHCFFDETENKYVSIKRENANEFIGHRFYNADENRWETLESVTLLSGTVDAYSIETEKTLNAVANGMLSNGDSLYRVLINIFEYGDGLKIDAEKKAADIEQYGLWNFAEAQYATEETYEAFNLQYITVAFGKGMITPEQFAGAGAYQTENNTDLVRTEAQEENQTDSLQSKRKMRAPAPNPLPTTIYLGGTVRIFGNHISSEYYNDNVFVWEDGPILGIGSGENAPKEGMLVGVSTSTGISEEYPFQFTISCSSDCEKYFVSDYEDYLVYFNTDHLELRVPHDGNYIINIVPSQNGTVTASAKEAAVNTDITLTVTPAKGYILKSLKYNDIDISGAQAFTMPDGNVTVTAVFEVHPHNLVKIEGQPATEFAPGYKDYYECKDIGDACGALFEDEDGTTPISDLTVWKSVGGNGYIEQLVHKATPVEGKEATHDEAGYKAYYECQNCGKYYEDSDGLELIENITVWKEEGGDGYLAPLHGTDADNDRKCDYCGNYYLYIVTFEMSGHGTKIPDQEVKEENKATRPTDPQEDGFVFDDWYTDSSFSEKFDFGATIADNITVYANWVEDVPDAYRVKLSNDGNGTASADKIEAKTGDTVMLSASPSTGYVFKEWQVVSGGVTITDNSFVMLSDEVEIKAVFEKHEHEYSDSWMYDSAFHWHNAVCDVLEGCKDAIADKAEHTWNEGKCSDCGYVCNHNGNAIGVCSLCGLDLGSGDIDLIVSGDIPSSAVIGDIEEAVGMSQTEIEELNAGNKFETEITINNTNPDEVTVEKINEVLSGEESTGACYIDITLLLKNISTNENRPVTETRQGVTVTLRVPDEIADNATNVGIVRYHDGVAEIIPSTYDPVTRTITFVTDKFSIYVVYGTTVPSPDKESDYIDPLRSYLNNLIARGASGDTVVWEAGDGLPYDVMQLIKNSELTLEFKYTYEGQEYDVFIDKYNVPEEYAEWYGPLYLAGLKRNTSAVAGDYTVVAGDTLNAIAARFNVTVDSILVKNPSITNPNLIFPGQVLDL